MDREKGRQNVGLGNLHDVMYFGMSVSAAGHAANVERKTKYRCVLLAAQTGAGSLLECPFIDF